MGRKPAEIVSHMDAIHEELSKCKEMDDNAFALVDALNELETEFMIACSDEIMELGNRLTEVEKELEPKKTEE